MERRTFIESAGPLALGLSVMPGALLAGKPPEIMTASELNAYLRSLTEVAEPSVDKIIIGNPETEIKKIGTAWMPYWATLKEAKANGVNTMVVHEPTFYTHRDLEETRGDFLSAPSPGKELYVKQVGEKQQWIEENQMVIIRCHDVLDKIEGFGIPFAFGRALGFRDSDIVRSKTYYNVYGIETRPAIEVARTIARKLSKVGQPGVAFYGDENFQVSTVGLGTGCICDPMEFRDMEMDMAIAIDDTIRTWTQTTFSEDTGRPLLVVNHGTTEEFGMRELSAHLDNAFPNIETLHFKQGCSYRWITA